MDETYLKVSGIWKYLYRAVDQFGQVIDVMLSQRRDTQAARRFFHAALSDAALPVEVTTDRVPVYPAVLVELLPGAFHSVEKYGRNSILRIGGLQYIEHGPKAVAQPRSDARGRRERHRASVQPAAPYPRSNHRCARGESARQDGTRAALGSRDLGSISMPSSEAKKPANVAPSPRLRRPHDSLELITKFRWTAQYVSAAHYRSAEHYHKMHVYLGFAAIAMASVVATSVFAFIGGLQAIGWKIATGMLAAAAASLSSLQTFLKLEDTAEGHKAAAIRYDEILHDADTILIRLANLTDRQPDTSLDDVRTIGAMMTSEDRKAPDIPDRIYKRVRRTFPLEMD